jgi:hypothetical protein
MMADCELAGREIPDNHFVVSGMTVFTADHRERLIPTQRAAGLVFGDSGFEEILFFL